MRDVCVWGGGEVLLHYLYMYSLYSSPHTVSITQHPGLCTRGLSFLPHTHTAATAAALYSHSCERSDVVTITSTGAAPPHINSCAGRRALADVMRVSGSRKEAAIIIPGGRYTAGLAGAYWWCVCMCVRRGRLQAHSANPALVWWPASTVPHAHPAAAALSSQPHPKPCLCTLALQPPYPPAEHY